MHCKNNNVGFSDKYTRFNYPVKDVSGRGLTKEKILRSTYLMADETPIPVQTSQKPGSTHKGYQWVYYSPLEKLVCFDYRKGRGRDGPVQFLKDFRGTIQTDGYAAYNDLEKSGDITLIACMAHAGSSNRLWKMILTGPDMYWRKCRNSTGLKGWHEIMN